MKYFLLIFMICFIGFCSFSSYQEQYEKAKENGTVQTTENVERNCLPSEKDRLKELFKNPKSVDFESCKVLNGTVRGEAYAENSFGGTVRSYFFCDEDGKCRIE